MERIRKIFSPKVSIYWVGTFIPDECLSSSEIENMIRKESNYWEFKENSIFEISWTYTRYFSQGDEQASTLAFKASQKALIDASMKIEEIDCLIFASASQDVIEPATANKVQVLLWSTAPVFDVKNACNSFLNWIQIATSFISSGQYKHILVCSWETPSRSIRWNTDSLREFKEAFAWYNLWDAWVAMILWKKREKLPEIVFTEFMSKGEYFDVSSIPWWGSCFPRDIEKLYFRSDSRKLSGAFQTWILEFTKKILKRNRWKFSGIHFFIPHIVSRYSKDVFLETFSLPHHKVLNYNSTHGNMASCSIPYAFITEFKNNRFSSSDRVLFVWLGAGATYGIVGVEFP